MAISSSVGSIPANAMVTNRMVSSACPMMVEEMVLNHKCFPFVLIFILASR